MTSDAPAISQSLKPATQLISMKGKANLHSHRAAPRLAKALSLFNLSILLLAGVLSLAWPGAVSEAQAAKGRVLSEVLEQITKRAGRAPSRTAREALEAAVRRHGDDMLQMADRGGLALMEAAGRHGDDIYLMARRYPGAARTLAHNADELMPLVRRHGDDVLLIEARAPGSAGNLVRMYPSPSDLARLQRLPDHQLHDVLALAARADSPATREQLLRAVENTGGGVLRRIDRDRVLTAGLTASMIVVATGSASAMKRVGEGIGDAAREAPESVFEHMGGTIVQLTSPLAWGAGLAVLVVVGYRCWRHHLAHPLVVTAGQTERPPESPQLHPSGRIADTGQFGDLGDACPATRLDGAEATATGTDGRNPQMRRGSKHPSVGLPNLNARH